jgi:hypothetical protein
LICVLGCSHRPVPFAAASCPHSVDCAYFLSSESRCCSRQADLVRDSERVQSGHRPCRSPRCRHGHDATSDPPPQSRSPRRKSSSR